MVRVARGARVTVEPFEAARRHGGPRLRIDGAERMISAHTARLWPPEQVFHVHFKTFVADPVSTVRRLYSHFGLGFTPELQATLGAVVRKKPQGGYARNVYRGEDYGLNAGEQRERFSDYMDCFGVEPEVAAA